MKKLVFLFAILTSALAADAQGCYWVFFTDKAGTTFDPYSYFDAKAIARYRLNNANLYDISNYPVNASYLQQVDAIAIEEVGDSRWLNAVAVMATPQQMQQILALPFVKGIREIAGQMEVTSCQVHSGDKAGTPHGEIQTALLAAATDSVPVLTDQLIRMQGQLFRDKGIDGKGVRVAVFDGGFPAVNTHRAFKHLRDQHRIIATWNFPNKKENVYGWSTHGTMVLSCIAGILNGKQLGLATGAEFLLARTEVEPEPYKEEVWWMKAMEWADKNGADVVNSSLGYGKDRHYTYEMDGRSTVAHAANMAARKGMLVCNSAGNEGEDRAWKTIITPGDADSILTVGGISAVLSSYSHISFSSYGPTANGRLKPNVCNFGQANVADPAADDRMGNVFGTSFSSPLTAGFVACARQLRPSLTAMQLKAEVEKSADLYPYFDYAFGYGVPQAGYFVNGKKEVAVSATFTFQEKDDYLLVKPTGVYVQRSAVKDEDGRPVEVAQAIFLKLTDSTGLVQHYETFEVRHFKPSNALAIHKSGLLDRKLTIFFGGYAQDYSLSPQERQRMIVEYAETPDFFYTMMDSSGSVINDATDQKLVRNLSDNAIIALGDRFFVGGYLQLGHVLRTDAANEKKVAFATPLSGNIGLNYQHAFRRWYRVGFGAFYGWTNAVTKKNSGNVSPKNVVNLRELGLEVFQRVRLKPGGALLHNGLFWDLGFYGSRGWNKERRIWKSDGEYNTRREITTSNLAYLRDYKWNYGLTTRIVNDWWGIYARYRLKDLGATKDYRDQYIPRLQVGLMVNF